MTVFWLQSRQDLPSEQTPCLEGFVRGPFFWTTGKGQEVFYVTVRDEAGDTSRGFV
jgi:hypothetical protein